MVSLCVVHLYHDKLLTVVIFPKLGVSCTVDIELTFDTFQIKIQIN